MQPHLNARFSTGSFDDQVDSIPTPALDVKLGFYYVRDSFGKVRSGLIGVRRRLQCIIESRVRD
jgi:hypothetical protein